MKIPKLKFRDFVVLRNGQECQVSFTIDALICVKDFRRVENLKNYNEDLTHKSNRNLDIMKVSRPDQDCLRLVWHREEEKPDLVLLQKLYDDIQELSKKLEMLLSEQKQDEKTHFYMVKKLEEIKNPHTRDMAVVKTGETYLYISDWVKIS